MGQINISNLTIVPDIKKNTKHKNVTFSSNYKGSCRKKERRTMNK